MCTRDLLHNNFYRVHQRIFKFKLRFITCYRTFIEIIESDDYDTLNFLNLSFHIPYKNFS